ncbi:contractile injection system protein, VgrG/Pvc8 family, partial [Burkholderia gladioli]|uniref:contractile injection system protein, VgrG/Pvc8 family n=1 Tax=Burkholderia gladioli TaxID=28095 RepID=UPI0024456221
MQNTAQALRDLALGPQHNRQVQISFPDGNAPDPILLPNAFEAVEALSKDFTYKIDLLSEKDKLAPKDFIGKRVTISLARGDGSSRYFNGHIFAFRHVRTDGGWVFYEAHVGPWLRYLKYSQHNRLFLDQNLHDQTATVFQDYG